MSLLAFYTLTWFFVGSLCLYNFTTSNVEHQRVMFLTILADKVRFVFCFDKYQNIVKLTCCLLSWLSTICWISGGTHWFVLCINSTIPMVLYTSSPEWVMKVNDSPSAPALPVLESNFYFIELSKKNPVYSNCKVSVKAEKWRRYIWHLFPPGILKSLNFWVKFCHLRNNNNYHSMRLHKMRSLKRNF